MSETTAAAATAAPTASTSTSSAVVKPEIKAAVMPDFNSASYEIEPSLSDEERRFYVRAYATIDVVTNRKVHCTVCRSHIGTAVNAESNLKMHPILRVTHCVKCHDFYNSGEFSKGEDGSELYCRWCGQGGEVYCCSNCPYVFCKSCIVKNLSRGVVADIEENENWNCFNCAPKILWPLRAQHWALVNYIEAQKKSIASQSLTESELRAAMAKDNSQCCRLAKSKAMSDSMESLESNTSKRSQTSAGSGKKPQPKSPYGLTPAKRPKTSNDEVVCTPDLLSMLEPDCQLTVAQKSRPSGGPSLSSTPRITSVSSQQKSTPPPLVLQNTSIKMRQLTPQMSAQTPTTQRQTLISVRPTGPNAATSPVYHTINGYRIDLNSAAQQDTFRLPNGKLIQVKRQGSTPQIQSQSSSSQNSQLLIRPRSLASVQQQRPVQSIVQNHYAPNSNVAIRQYHPNPLAAAQAQIVRIGQPHAGPATSISLPPSTTLQQVNGAQIVPGQPQRPSMTRYVFPKNPIGQARTQLQDQIFGAMELCMHLTSKVQTLTNSNAYKQARSHLEVKELYIHLSYLFTYAIGRYKGLQDKLLADMRQLGFTNDADSLENGQLAAAVDYVCYGQLNDVDLFNTGPNSFHNQVYEYRKSLHSNLKEGEVEPLPPLFPLGVRADGDPEEEDEKFDANENNDDWPNGEELEDNDNDQVDDNFYDGADDMEADETALNAYESTMDETGSAAAYGTEESMTRNEQAHAFDRKLTRLLRAYPSIWCTKHPDYGNFELKRKHWRVVASHFKRGDNLKVRWKNIRKRYVRIERRTAAGKRFNGYFDTATNFLANRNLPEEEWIDVDCGEDDGDNFERKELDAIEDTLHSNSSSNKRMREPEAAETVNDIKYGGYQTSSTITLRPLDVKPMDDRIINFAKSHPVLWRKSSDPQFDCIDEQTRKSLWANFWKSMPNKQASDDEENEIEIVEPKTDTITIDSDNEDEPAAATAATSPAKNKQQPQQTTEGNVSSDIDLNDFTTSILASMLEVDFTEGKTPLPGCVAPVAEARKQPRKKTTNKPNPALLQLELERQSEIIRTDPKLKKKAVVRLRRAHESFEIAKQFCEAKQNLREQQEKKSELQLVAGKEASLTQDNAAAATEHTNPSDNDIIKDATDAESSSSSVEKDLTAEVVNNDATLLKEQKSDEQETTTLKPDNDSQENKTSDHKDETTTVSSKLQADQTETNESEAEKAKVSEDSSTANIDVTKQDGETNSGETINKFKAAYKPVTTKAALKELIETKIVATNDAADDDESIVSQSPKIDKTLTETCVESGPASSMEKKDVVVKDNDDQTTESSSDKDTTADCVKTAMDEQTINDKKSQETTEKMSETMESKEEDVEMKELDAAPETTPPSSEKSNISTTEEDHPKDDLHADDITPKESKEEDVEMKELDATLEATPTSDAKSNISSTGEEQNSKGVHADDTTPNESGVDVDEIKSSSSIKSIESSEDVAQKLNTDKEETSAAAKANFQGNKATVQKSVLLNDLELEDILSDDSNLSMNFKTPSAAEASTSNSQSAVAADSSATDATSAPPVDTSLCG